MKTNDPETIGNLESYSSEIYALETLYEIEERDQITNPDENDLLAESLRTLGLEEINFVTASESFNQWLNQTALSLEVFTNRTNTAQIAEILRACGGTRVEFIRDNRNGENIIMEYRDGSIHETVTIWARNVSQELDGMMEYSC